MKNVIQLLIVAGITGLVALNVSMNAKIAVLESHRCTCNEQHAQISEPIRNEKYTNRIALFP